MNNTDKLVHEVAIVALVLGRDDLSVSALRERYTIYTLPSVLDGLLVDLEAAVLETGKYDVPMMVDAGWLAALMQIEIGSVVTARRLTNPDRRYLVAK